MPEALDLIQGTVGGGKEREPYGGKEKQLEGEKMNKEWREERKGWKKGWKKELVDP